METSTLDALIAWIGAHPLAAGAVIFLVAFIDALLAIGLLMPSGPILFAVGAMVGLGSIDATYAIACAAAGAFLGDGLSYSVGRHYGQRMRSMWPFARHPDWLARGEAVFSRHGLKGVLIGRWVGAVRPFVPAIAGMLRMPVRTYLPASGVAAVTWALMFIGPGWLLGASLELLFAVAGRLAIVLGILAAMLLAIWVSVSSLYSWFAPRASGLIERALGWSHRHPVVGRFSGALIDPNRPESASLALLALLLIAAGVGFFWLLIGVAGPGRPLGLDLALHHALFQLRSPIADQLLVLLAMLGDWQVLMPASLAVFLWLLWRRRTIAAMHWLAAIGFGLVLVQVLGAVLDVPRPPAAMAVPGFGFPSAQVTLATVVYGFFAVLIARELPGRRRAWPYVMAGLLVALVGFSRLYLGAHWPSDVLAGVTLGLAWIGILGLAYRRRVVRSFWVRPVASVFFMVVAGAAIWHGLRNGSAMLESYALPVTRQTLPADVWWADGWMLLPQRRNDMHGPRAWPMNVQYAGSLEALEGALAAEGWAPMPTTGWSSLLRALDGSATAETLPVLPASHYGRADVLVMSRAGNTPDERLVLRMWSSPLVLEPGGAPVWQGTAMTMYFEPGWPLSLWRVDDAPEATVLALQQALPGLPRRRAERSSVPANGVLLLRQPGPG
jgi:membrane protein DedA with SNARE-associated domain/membrane-associated phospholipid phosphatase